MYNIETSPENIIPKAKSSYAFVIALECLNGIQTARILHRCSVPVVGIVGNPKKYLSRTNVCKRILKSDHRGTEFIDLLKSIGPTLNQKAVLFPCTDQSVLHISRRRLELQEWFHFALPDEGVVEKLMDKAKFYQFATDEGFLIPRTFLLKSREDAKRAAEQLNYPCLLKPTMRSTTWHNKMDKKALLITDSKELLETYEATNKLADMLAQEWIEGDDSTLFSMNCYFSANSDPLVTFIARKIRQYPPRIGASCLGEEVRNDVVLQESLRLFKHVKYHGLGYLEMKRDVHTGNHYIIEPNIGRPTVRSPIAEAGGVELLYTMYCDLAQLPLPRNREQKYTGVKWIYLINDLQSAWYYWRCGELTIREWWRSLKGHKAYALFSWRDPLPFLFNIRYVVLRRLMKMLKKRIKME